MMARRTFIKSAAALAALSPLTAFAQGPGTRPVLLVTAKGRAKPATLIVVNNVPYVIDCGDGVALQLVRAGVGLERAAPCLHHPPPLRSQPRLRRLWCCRASCRATRRSPRRCGWRARASTSRGEVIVGCDLLEV